MNSITNLLYLYRSKWLPYQGWIHAYRLYFLFLVLFFYFSELYAGFYEPLQMLLWKEMGHKPIRIKLSLSRKKKPSMLTVKKGFPHVLKNLDIPGGNTLLGKRPVHVATG